jgi:hypothetical protein
MHRRPQVRAEAPYQFDWRPLVRTALAVASVALVGAACVLLVLVLVGTLPAWMALCSSALSIASLGSRSLSRPELSHPRPRCTCRRRDGERHKPSCAIRASKPPRCDASIPGLDAHPIDAYEATLGWLRSKLLSDELSGEVYALCVDSLEQVHEALRGAARQRLTSAYSRPRDRLTVLPAGTRITPVTCSRCRDGLLRQGDSFQCCVCGRGQARRDLAGVADLLESMR